jgi:CDP-paratose 2-epimerase
VFFTSTNKVYGALPDVPMRSDGDGWEPTDPRLRARGVGEDRPLDFHSPYGCSKGVADQYLLDYARTFGLRTVVFRMSCIYGPRQFGTEDQGWVAHFLLRALDREPIVIYGDGLQVRDILYVDDLVDALLLAQRHIDQITGRAFNVGGGPERTTSLIELVVRMRELMGAPVTLAFDAQREADQRYYVSDTRAFAMATGWTPRVGVREGVRLLAQALRSRRFAVATDRPASPRRAASPTGGDRRSASRATVAP